MRLIDAVYNVGEDARVSAQMARAYPAFAVAFAFSIAEAGAYLAEVLDMPTCDICDHIQPHDMSWGEAMDWNAETGNHYSCEEGR